MLVKKKMRMTVSRHREEKSRRIVDKVVIAKRKRRKQNKRICKASKQEKKQAVGWVITNQSLPQAIASQHRGSLRRPCAVKPLPTLRRHQPNTNQGWDEEKRWE
jgi:hypothetical protein